MKESLLYGTLPADLIWTNGTSLAGQRCHCCFGWIAKGDDVVKVTTGFTGYVAHPECVAQARVRAQSKAGRA